MTTHYGVPGYRPSCGDAHYANLVVTPKREAVTCQRCAVTVQFRKDTWAAYAPVNGVQVALASNPLTNLIPEAFQ